MNDNTPSSRSDLPGLRLFRAFLRIRDQRTRNELVEHAERLAAELSAGSMSRLPGSSREFAAEQPTDHLS